MEYLFYTELDVDECVRRFEQAADEKNFLFAVGSSKIFLNWADKYKFHLMKRFHHKSPFIHFFIGQLKKQNKGTEIQGHFAMHPYVGSFMIVWGLAALISGSIFICALFGFFAKNNTVVTGTYLDFAFFPAMLLIGFVSRRIYKWFVRDEREYTLDFIKNTFEVCELA